MQRSLKLLFVVIYTVLMIMLITFAFVVLPFFGLVHHSKFVSLVLWLFLTLTYISMLSAVKNMIAGKTYLYTKLKKNSNSLLSLSLSSFLGAIFYYLILNWSLGAYLFFIPYVVIQIVSVINGIVVGVINFIQYYQLPEE